MDARPGPAVNQRIYNDIVPPHDLTQGDRVDTIIIDVTGMFFFVWENYIHFFNSLS